MVVQYFKLSLKSPINLGSAPFYFLNYTKDLKMLFSDLLLGAQQWGVLGRMRYETKLAQSDKKKVLPLFYDYSKIVNNHDDFSIHGANVEVSSSVFYKCLVVFSRRRYARKQFAVSEK